MLLEQQEYGEGLIAFIVQKIRYILLDFTVFWLAGFCQMIYGFLKFSTV